MAKPEDLIKCYNCGKSLLIDRIIDGKRVKEFSPERTQTEFYISNNSRMPVSVCTTCYNLDLTDPDIQQNIMQNVINGWQDEQNILVSSKQITMAQSDNIMAVHNDLSILFKSENMNDYQIQARSVQCPSSVSPILSVQGQL